MVFKIKRRHVTAIAVRHPEPLITYGFGGMPFRHVNNEVSTVTVPYSDGFVREMRNDDPRVQSLGEMLRHHSDLSDARKATEETEVTVTVCVELPPLAGPSWHDFMRVLLAQYDACAIAGTWERGDRDFIYEFKARFFSLASMYKFFADYGPVSVHGKEARDMFILITDSAGEKIEKLFKHRWDCARCIILQPEESRL